MTVETLYRPKGAGHSAPSGGKREYMRPSDRLVESYQNWMESCVYYYPWAGLAGFNLDGLDKDCKFYQDAAERILEVIPNPESAITAGDIVALPMAPVDIRREEDKRFREKVFRPKLDDIGFFMSAAFNLSGLKELVVDCDTKYHIDGLGFLLGEDKTLVIHCKTGFSAAEWSRGRVVNYGDGEVLGEHSMGIVVNYDDLDYHLGPNATGLLVNFGKIDYVQNNGSNGHYGGYGYDRNYATGKFLGERKPTAIPGTLNFGKLWMMSNAFGGFIPGPAINHGIVRGKMGLNSGDLVLTTSAVEELPDPEEYNRPTVVDERVCAEVPGITEYLNGLKEALGPHRPYREVLDVLEALDMDADINRILREAGRLEA